MVKRRSAGPAAAQLKRAFRALEQGQYRSALRQFERLWPQAQADPTLAEQVRLAMADAHLSLRNLPQAVTHAAAALALNPASEQAYYLLGFAHSLQAEWEQAIAALRQAIALNPAEAEYYRALGWTLFSQGQAKAEGQELLEKALKMAPTHIPTLTDLAMLHGHEQRFDQALIFARRAVELAPTMPMAQEILAGLLHFKQEFDRLGGQPAAKPSSKPSTDAEWRGLIASTDDYRRVMQLWLDLHPADNITDLNTGLQRFNELWNSTPRPELGGRSSNEMTGRPAKRR